MDSKQIVNELKKHLGEDKYDFTFDEKHDKLRLEHKQLKRGMEIAIAGIVSKYEVRKETAIQEVLYTITQTFEAMEQEAAQGFSASAKIFPVIRSTSFPKDSKDGNPFIITPHTAETAIYYALDLGTTYRLIDTKILAQLGLTEQQVKEAAIFTTKQLPTAYKRDEVSGNVFYFINHNDGYDASRILNSAFLNEMLAQTEGDMTISVPHQDVLIIGDIRNEVGYDVLAQMTMHFFTVGAVPITSLSFVYDGEKLEPVFILAKNKVNKEQDKK
jgi:uncharacterized protein YtpQ (UPF0354 family)